MDLSTEFTNTNDNDKKMFFVCAIKYHFLYVSNLLTKLCALSYKYSPSLCKRNPVSKVFILKRKTKNTEKGKRL